MTWTPLSVMNHSTRRGVTRTSDPIGKATKIAHGVPFQKVHPAPTTTVPDADDAGAAEDEGVVDRVTRVNGRPAIVPVRLMRQTSTMSRCP